jgi:hypothetical protein
MANRFRRASPLFSKYDPAPESWRAAGLREWLLVIRLAGPDERHAHLQARERDGVGFVVAGPLTFSSCTYDYGSVPVSALDLDVDPGYNGNVLFEVRWYGVANSYSNYTNACVEVTVNTNASRAKTGNRR